MVSVFVEFFFEVVVVLFVIDVPLVPEVLLISARRTDLFAAQRFNLELLGFVLELKIIDSRGEGTQFLNMGFFQL